MPRIECRYCREEFHVPSSSLGDFVRCPECGEKFKARAAEDDRDADRFQSGKRRESLSDRDRDDNDRRRCREADSWDELDRQRSRRKRKPAATGLIVVLVVAGVLVVGLAIGVVVAVMKFVAV